jgi:hypothetical protein
MTVHRATEEISLNWKDLYTNLFREERLLPVL